MAETSPELMTCEAHGNSTDGEFAHALDAILRVTQNAWSGACNDEYLSDINTAAADRPKLGVRLRSANLTRLSDRTRRQIPGAAGDLAGQKEESPMRKIISACLWSLLLATSVPAFAQQGGSPTIAVSANGNTVSAQVGNQPGRSPFFLFFDRQGAFVEAANNPHKDAGNAGISTLDFLAGKGIKVVVAESFGPKIVEVMKDKGMRPLEFKGSAMEAVKKALALK